MPRAYIGLGANLGEREAAIREALTRLGERDGIAVAAVSTLRETEPVGYADQPPFLNGAAALDTELSPERLLAALLEVERELGRVRGGGPRFGPRPIDLDLLVYEDETRAAPGLELPHPRLHERRFALEPLAELDPGLVVPGRGPVRDLLARLE